MAMFYKKRKLSKKKKILIFLAVILLIINGVLLYTANLFYKTGMITENKKDVYYKNRDSFSKDKVLVTKYEDVSEISLGSGDKNIEKWHTINDRDFVIVSYAHKQEIETNKWAVVVHGYENSASGMSEYAKMFFSKGFNVLVVDNEYHGESEGNHISMGIHDSINVLNWTKEIVKQDSDAEIVLFGLSMGASTVMLASDPQLNPQDNIKVIVEDCGFTSMDDIFTYQLKKDYGLPRLPIILSVDIYNYLKNDYRFNERTPLKAVSNTKIPMLFIHGDEDDYVPFDMLEQLYEAHQGEKDIYIVEGAEHANSIDIAYTQYEQRIFDFVHKYIK